MSLSGESRALLRIGTAIVASVSDTEDGEAENTSQAEIQLAMLEHAERYWAVWPVQRQALLENDATVTNRLFSRYGVTSTEKLSRLHHEQSVTTGERDPELASWFITSQVFRSRLVYAFLLGPGKIAGIHYERALSPTIDLSRAYPVSAVIVRPESYEGGGAPVDRSVESFESSDITLDSYMAVVANEEIRPADIDDRATIAALQRLADLGDAWRTDDYAAAYYDFAAIFWTWYLGRGTQRRAANASPSYTQTAIQTALAQPTFQEIKRAAQGLARARSGEGWKGIINGFGLEHVIKGAAHNLKIDGERIAFWGKPNDNESLLKEIGTIGDDMVATLFIAIALVLISEDGYYDIELDELISRIGLDPRSTAERAKLRTKVWRMLMIIGATEVVGERRKKVRDNRTGKSIVVGSNDPMLNVRAWRPVGTQEAFDDSEVPAIATLSVSPFLARFRRDRRVLQDFGLIARVSKIPSGHVSGAWARAVGWALQQLWREGATHTTTTFGRVGDDHKITVRFRPFTRRELLELFPPSDPTVHEILRSENPSRAIKYWDMAIGKLKEQRLIGFYDAVEDWSTRRRKGWEAEWLDEPLDIRPIEEDALALREISSAASSKRRNTEKRVTAAAAIGSKKIN